MKKFELFPTPVWHIDGASQSLVDVLYDGAYKCRDSIECVNQSNEEGYHSPYFDWNQFDPEGIETPDGYHEMSWEGREAFLLISLADKSAPLGWFVKCSTHKSTDKSVS